MCIYNTHPRVFHQDPNQLDDSPDLLIEVKAIGLKLKENHIKQAVDYAANQGIDWVILTNGQTWQVYKLRFEKPISAKLIYEFEFLELNPRKQADLEKLFILCREGLQKNAMLDFSNYKQVVNKYFIGAILQDEVLSIIQNGVLKRELVESEEAEAASTRYRKLQRKAQTKKAASKSRSPG